MFVKLPDQAVPHNLKNLVSDIVSKCIVDHLEVVQIHIKQIKGSMIGYSVLQLADEPGAVIESGQGVCHQIMFPSGNLSADEFDG